MHGNNKDIREYLLGNNYIEGIITLPSRLFAETGIATNTLILSHNNQFVKMVDASNLYKKDHLTNVLDDSHLEEILKAYRKESEISTEVSIEQLKENNFSLVPKRYTREDLNLENKEAIGKEIESGYLELD